MFLSIFCQSWVTRSSAGFTDSELAGTSVPPIEPPLPSVSTSPANSSRDFFSRPNASPEPCSPCCDSFARRCDSIRIWPEALMYAVPFTVVRMASRPTTPITNTRNASAMISACIRVRNDLPPKSGDAFLPASKVVVTDAAPFFAGFSFGAGFASALPLPRPMFNALRFIAIAAPNLVC